MKSREELTLEDRGKIQIASQKNFHLLKCYKALLAAEAEIEEKDKIIEGYEDRWIGHHNKLVDTINELFEEQEKVESKDKEIAELKDLSTEDKILIGHLDSKISALKEEVERLKEFEFMYKTLNK